MESNGAGKEMVSYHYRIEEGRLYIVSPFDYNEKEKLVWYFTFLNTEHEWETDPLNIVSWDNGVAEHPENVNAQYSGTLAGAFDQSNYKMMDLSYLRNAGNLTTEGDGDATFSMLSSNSFSAAAPKVVSFSDGSALAVWTDAAAAEYDAIQLYYSFFNGKTWEEAKLLCNDGTMDGSAYVTAVGNTAYIVWQDMERSV